MNRETDVVDTMRISIRSFIPTLAAAMALTMVGCGGGGNGSVPEPTGNPHLVSADAVINSPKSLIQSSGFVFVANQNGIGLNGVLSIDSNDQLRKVGFTGLTNAIGLAASPAGVVYVSAIPSSGLPSITTLTPVALALPIGSHYGFMFDANANLYAADVSTTGGRTPTIGFSSASGYSSWSGNISNSGTPKGFAYKNGFIYFTTDEGDIYKITQGTTSVTKLVLSGLALEKPNGIAFDGEVMYVVNYGAVGGASSWIAKITNESVVTEFKRDPNWLCASAGIAVRGNYVYVSNGTATSTGCGNIQNTIVKFFH